MIIFEQDPLNSIFCIGEVCKTGYYWLGSGLFEFGLPGVIIACAVIVWKKRKKKKSIRN